MLASLCRTLPQPRRRSARRVLISPASFPCELRFRCRPACRGTGLSQDSRGGSWLRRRRRGHRESAMPAEAAHRDAGIDRRTRRRCRRCGYRRTPVDASTDAPRGYRPKRPRSYESVSPARAAAARRPPHSGACAGALCVGPGPGRPAGRLTPWRRVRGACIGLFPTKFLKFFEDCRCTFRV